MGGFDQLRKERFEKIRETVEKNPSIHLDELRSKIIVETGLTSEKVEEYIDELCAADKIRVSEDMEVFPDE